MATLIGRSLNDAVALHRQGDFDAAEQIYLQILKGQPNHGGALTLLGTIRQQQGRHQESLELIGRAIEINASVAVYHNNYASALISLKRFPEAEKSLRRALSLRPDYVDALVNLGLVEKALGRPEAAVANLRQALRHEPRHRRARKRLVALLQNLGRSDEALQTIEQALVACPSAETSFDYGNLLLLLGRPQDAVAAYRNAVKLNPTYAAAHFNLAGTCEELCDSVHAKEHFDRAAALRPDKPLWRLRAAICRPAVFDDASEIENYCERVMEAVAAYSSRSAVMSVGRQPQGHHAERDEYEAFETAAFPGIAYSYHGRNQRALKESFARFYEPRFETSWHRLPADDASMARMAMPRSRRIGIVVTERHESMFLASMRGIIENLDGERFEVVVLCSQSIVETLRKRISRTGLRFVGFDRSLVDAARRIRASACDLIYYWEVGTDALNYFLPFLRLAPVQATGWGSTITTGIPSVDYFMSSELIEQSGSAEQYTERLWNSRTLFRYQNRLPPTPPAQPGHFGLPDDRNLYICFQNPLKLHPDFDALMAGILATDAKALIVLLSDASGQMKRLLQERLARRIPDAGRIVFLSRQSSTDYRRLIQLADVILDPLHFGAGSSCYDLFSYNLPVVTMPGELIVGRITQACYGKMGVMDLVVSSAHEYVNKAVQLAMHRDYRAFVVERIAESSDSLFNDLEAVREYERFFAEAFAAQ